MTVKRVLVVLAAGVGSRYGGLKQLAPIGPGGETLLEYSVYDALRAGFSRVVLIVRSENEHHFLEGSFASCSTMATKESHRLLPGPVISCPLGSDILVGRWSHFRISSVTLSVCSNDKHRWIWGMVLQIR